MNEEKRNVSPDPDVRPRLPKVISAVLDMMPRERSWREEEFEEWFEMFEGACRIWYRVPRKIVR